jgi:hypothetical protein
MSSTIATMRFGSVIDGIRDSRNGATILKTASRGMGVTMQATRRKGMIAPGAESRKETGSSGGTRASGVFTNRGTMNHARTIRAYAASPRWRYRLGRLPRVKEAPSVVPPV